MLKVNDENSRIQIQDPDPNPDPDPLVRGMDPRIRIHNEMSWIRNTGLSITHETFRVTVPPAVALLNCRVYEKCTVTI